MQKACCIRQLKKGLFSSRNNKKKQVFFMFHFAEKKHLLHSNERIPTHNEMNMKFLTFKNCPLAETLPNRRF